MKTFSALLALSSVTGEFPSQRPVTWSFDVFFDLHPNKRLSTQTRRRWFETPSRLLWRNCNDICLYRALLPLSSAGYGPSSRPNGTVHSGGRFLRRPLGLLLWSCLLWSRWGEYSENSISSLEIQSYRFQQLRDVTLRHPTTAEWRPHDPHADRVQIVQRALIAK